MPHEQLLRLFLAIDLPDVIRQAAGRLQSRLKPIFNSGTYGDPENLHITLHFLGDTAVSKLPGLIEAFNKVPVPVMEFQLGELIYFPDAQRARVASLEITGDTPLLSDLYDRLGVVLKHSGFRLDHRAFKPHITVTRFKFPPRQGVEEAIETARRVTEQAKPFRAGQFTLYQSTLDPKGARYAPLGKFPRSVMGG